MSLLGSISGFLSSIGSTPIVGRGPLTELSRSVVLPRMISPHPTPSDSSPTSQPEVLSYAGSRRTSSSSSSCWSSRSSMVREGSVDPAPTDLDLSHLTDDERAQIEAVMERARLIQQFDAYDLVTSSSAIDVDPDSSSELTADDGRPLGSDGKTRERPSDTCVICRQPGITFDRVCYGCHESMRVCPSCVRSTPGDEASSTKVGETLLCLKCSETTRVSSRFVAVQSSSNKSSTAETELVEHEDELTSHGVWPKRRTAERSGSFEDSASSPYSSSTSSSTDTSFDIPTPDGPDPEPLVLFSPEDSFARTPEVPRIPEVDGLYSPTESCAVPEDGSDAADAGGTSWWCSSLEELVDSDFFCEKSGPAPRVPLDLLDFEVGQKEDDANTYEIHRFDSESSTMVEGPGHSSAPMHLASSPSDEGQGPFPSIHLSITASVHPSQAFSPSTDRPPQSVPAPHQSDYYSSEGAITFSPPHPGSPRDEAEEKAEVEEAIPGPPPDNSQAETSPTDVTRDTHRSNGIFEVAAVAQFLTASEILLDCGGIGSQRSVDHNSSNSSNNSFSTAAAPARMTMTNGNPFLEWEDRLRVEEENEEEEEDKVFFDRSVEIFESLFSQLSPEVTTSTAGFSFLSDASDTSFSDFSSTRDATSHPDYRSTPPLFPDSWDQSKGIQEMLTMSGEPVSRVLPDGIFQTESNQRSNDAPSFATIWSLSSPESSLFDEENNGLAIEHRQPEVAEPPAVKNSEGRTHSYETMRLYPVTEQPEVENLSSSRSLNAIETLDTSPTIGMFKRCPSYSNILALPSLSTSGHLSNPLLSVTRSPTPRRNSEGSTPQSSTIFDLAPLQEGGTTTAISRKQEAQCIVGETLMYPDYNSVSAKPLGGQEAVGEVRFTLGDDQLKQKSVENLTDIVRKISPVVGAETTILWLDTTSPVGPPSHGVSDQCAAREDCTTSQSDDTDSDSKRDIKHAYTPSKHTEKNENDSPRPSSSSSLSNGNKTTYVSDQSFETQCEASRSSGFLEERRASLTPPSDTLTVMGADEQIFLSDEELREIDLDEDIPPKHMLVRKSSRPKLPFCSAKSAPSFGRRVFEGLTDQWEPRWDELNSVDFGKLEGSRSHERPEFRNQAGSLDDLQSRQVRRRLPALPPSDQWSLTSSAVAAAAAAGRPLRLAEIRKLRPMLNTRSLSADASTTYHQSSSAGGGGGLPVPSSRQRPNSKCLAMSRSLSVESRSSRDFDPSFHQDHRNGRPVNNHQQPVVHDARHRRSASTKSRSKSAEVPPPRAPVSSVLPPRSYSADDRHSIPVQPLSTGGGRTPNFRIAAGDSEKSGHDTITIVSINELNRNGAGQESWRTALQEEQEAFQNTDTESKALKQELVDSSEDETIKGALVNHTCPPVASPEKKQTPVAMVRKKIPPKIPPKPRRLMKKEVADVEEEPAPPPFVSIFGLSVPTSVHSWMLRVKDEVKIVTATKRLRLDEAEEVRIMEAELAVRTKERRRSAIKAEQEEREKRKAKAESERAEAEAVSNASEALFLQRRLFDSDVHMKHFFNEDFGGMRRIDDDRGGSRRTEVDPWRSDDDRGRPRRPNADHGAWNTTPAGADQSFRLEEISQFAMRHKRQGSDPSFSVPPRLLKNADPGSMSRNFETLPRFDRSRIVAERAAPQPIHLGITVLTQRKTDTSPPQRVAGSQPTLLATEEEGEQRRFPSASAGRLVSGSTGSLPVMLAATSSKHQMEFYARECEALRKKKEKIDRLQREIDRRRQHLSETLRQCEQLRSDAQRATTTAATTVPGEPRSVVGGQVEEGFSSSSFSTSLPASVEVDPEDKGLIRPIDFPIDPEKYYVKFEPPPRNSVPPDQGAFDSSVYSSFEYFVHKTEHHAQHQQHRRRPDSAFRGVSSSSSPAWSSLPHRHQDTIDSHTLFDAAPYSESEDAYYYSHGTYGSSSHDSGVSSTITGTDTLPCREQTPPPAPPARPHPRAIGDRRRGPRGADYGPSSASYVPASGTPPMPILDDVASRSRSVLRGMGSRPISDDMEKYFQSEAAAFPDPLQLMYKEGSDGSVAESIEESAMEGGTTLRRNVDRRQFRAVISHLHKYSFPTKRILLTSDSKDRTFKGFGIKIRGGQVLPWMGDDVGAYVAYIYPGSSADQLHGELQEGDQVLEINGEPLGGKTELELRQILSRCNCEMELVVRHGVNMRSYPSNTMSTLSTLQTDSNRSSYDNIPTVSSCDGIDSFDGGDKDPTRLSSDVLDSVLDRKSMLLTSGDVIRLDNDVIDRRIPSLLSGNEISIVPMGSNNRRHIDNKRAITSPSNRGNGFLGEIQLQLSYDDYESTLNVHVIQARNLQPVKFKSGYADPFVKVYLLPYKSRTESKRRAKCVPRTLSPEWHRTMVFVDVHPSELPLKTLDVSVWDHDHLLPDQLMGHISLEFSDLSLLDNRPRWYQLTDEQGGGRPANGNCRGPSLVPNGGTGTIMPSSDSSSSSNLSKPSSSRRQPGPDRKSPWSNMDRSTPKPPAAPPRPSPRNTPDGWKKGEEQKDQVGMQRLLQGECPPSDVNSINHNAYLLSGSDAANDALSSRRPQQPVITHQRNSVYPITRMTENSAPWGVVDPSASYSADVRRDIQCEIKFETKPKGVTCIDCLLLFFCCSRSRGVVPPAAL